MTKCIIIGEELGVEKAKPIEFIYFVAIYPENPICTKSGALPYEYQNIELIRRGKFDLMLAYNNNRHKGDIYLGHWNDGVV